MKPQQADCRSKTCVTASSRELNLVPSKASVGTEGVSWNHREHHLIGHFVTPFVYNITASVHFFQVHCRPINALDDTMLYSLIFSCLSCNNASMIRLTVLPFIARTFLLCVCSSSGFRPLSLKPQFRYSRMTMVNGKECKGVFPTLKKPVCKAPMFILAFELFPIRRMIV